MPKFQKPVRKIRKSRVSRTGYISARGEQPAANYESSLERDLFVILRFDLGYEVDYYCHQPLYVEVPKPNGKKSQYPIDAYVEFCANLNKYPRLIETKYRKDLRKRWAEWKPKFREAHKSARAHGARFHIYTERHIRTPYLDNAKFLQGPKDQLEIPELTQRLIGQLDYLGPLTPERLLTSLSEDPLEVATLKPMLWHLIAHRRIKTDLNLPLDPLTSVLELGILQ